MKLKFESEKFATPSLENVRKALLTGLKENYEQVNIEVVDCPNLKDWGCPSEGISGNEKIIDVGGEPYMHDKRFIGTEFDYEEIQKTLVQKNHMLWVLDQELCLVYMGHCGELVINENFITSESKSVIARVGKIKMYSSANILPKNMAVYQIFITQMEKKER